MELVIKKLSIKKDHRGWLVELIRPELVNGEKLGQLLITVAYPGQSKGGHYHKRKKEWYCVIKGVGRLEITDLLTGEKKDIELNGSVPMLVQIPQHAMHAITNVGKEDMFLLAYTDEVFCEADPDVYYE